MTQMTVYTARRIRTMDPGRPLADAVAIKNRRIVSVGTLESMRPWLDTYAHQVDDRFKDKVIFPGFIDPHTHFRMSGVFMGLTYLGPIDQQGPRGFNKGLASRSEVLDKLRQVDSEQEDPFQPIVAWGLDPALDRRARTSLRAVVFGAWVLVEGLSHRGDLVVVPTLRIVAGWPDRVSGWFDNPSRWAVPLEVLLTATVLLAVVLNASALLRKRHR